MTAPQNPFEALFNSSAYRARKTERERIRAERPRSSLRDAAPGPQDAGDGCGEPGDIVGEGHLPRAFSIPRD